MSTLHRSRKKELEYRKYLKLLKTKNVECVFCNKDYYETLDEFKLFRLINNKFPYTLWDSCSITEHHMIVPKRHIDSLTDLNKQESMEYFKLLAFYESKGYDIYSRGLSSTMKSVRHQHTHLLKTDGIKIKGLVYNETPLIHVTY